MKPEHTSSAAVGIASRCGSCSTQGEGDGQHPDLARRGFLRNAIAGTVVGMLAGATVTSARPAAAQTTLTPEAALKMMMDGNQRYAEG